MEPIDIFNSFNRAQADRIGRNAKILFNAAKFGKKGLSNLNPASVYIDAVISVGEAIVSFYNYQMAKEKTKQLEMDLKELKRIYANKKKELEAQEKKLKEKLYLENREINKELENEKEKFAEILKPIYELSRNYLYFCKQNLDEIRREYPTSEKVKDIEKKFLESVEASMFATLSII